MNNVRLLHRLIPGLLVGYLVLALLAIPTRRHEVFPFFCWFLFPITPNVETRFQIIVRENDGEDLDPAVPYEHALDSVRRPHSMDAHVAMQALGRAVESDRRGEQERARAVLEGNFLNEPCRYDLVEIKLDPYRQWRQRASPARREVASFECDYAPIRQTLNQAGATRPSSTGHP